MRGVVLVPSDSLDILWLDTDFSMDHTTWQDLDTDPGATRDLPGGAFTSPPAGVSLAPNRLDVFALGLDYSVYHRTYDATAKLGGGFALRIGPGQREQRSYRYEPSCRGALRFAGFRVVTRFPFGLFAKSLWIERPAEVIVYPPLAPAAPPSSHAALRSIGQETSGRSDDESEVAGLRAFAPGDAPRRVHWRASWRRSALLVRDAEGDASGETEVVLQTRGTVPGEGFERAVERAAAQAEAGFRAGLRVGLRTEASALAPGAGTVHRARLLGYLALVQPEHAADEERERE